MTINLSELDGVAAPLACFPCLDEDCTVSAAITVRRGEAVCARHLDPAPERNAP